MKLGDTIRVTAIYRRRQRWLEYNRTEKYWEVTPIAPRAGLYIGRRTLANGIRMWIGDEEGIVFERRENVPALLVVFSERERPVLVPTEDALRAILEARRA